LGLRNFSATFYSDFKDLFDWKYFIETLKDEVHIVETLPAAYEKTEPFMKTPISWSKVKLIMIIEISIMFLFLVEKCIVII